MGRMEDSDKFGYAISTSALIVLLLSSFAARGADSPTGTRQERSNSAKAYADEPLSLALSLSLASFSGRYPPMPANDTSLSVHEEAPIRNGANGTGADPMLSLSQTLSSPLPPVTANKDENLAAIAKDGGAGGFTSREALFGGDEQPEIKSPPVPGMEDIGDGLEGIFSIGNRAHLC